MAMDAHAMPRNTAATEPSESHGTVFVFGTLLLSMSRLSTCMVVVQFGRFPGRPCHIDTRQKLYTAQMCVWHLPRRWRFSSAMCLRCWSRLPLAQSEPKR